MSRFKLGRGLRTYDRLLPFQFPEWTWTRTLTTNNQPLLALFQVHAIVCGCSFHAETFWTSQLVHGGCQKDCLSNFLAIKSWSLSWADRPPRRSLERRNHFLKLPSAAHSRRPSIRAIQELMRLICRTTLTKCIIFKCSPILHQLCWLQESGIMETAKRTSSG